MFVFFMVWYFLICSSNSIAPSDFSLISVAIVCAVECIVAAFIKMRGEGLTKKDEQSVEFIASVIAKVLDIAPPDLRGAEQGTKDDDVVDDTDEYAEEDSEDDEEAVG